MECMPKQGVVAAWGLWVLLVSGCGGGPSNREEALDIVLDDVVDTSAHPALEIFATPAPLPAGSQIAVAFDDASTGPKTLATLTEPSWLLFVDLAPGSRFEHPVQIVLVTQEEGRHQVFDAGWWPKVDGEDKWISREAREMSGDRIYVKSPPGSPQGLRQGGGGMAATVPAYCRPEDIQKWALTLSTADDAAVDPGETDDFALLLKSHGFTIQTLKPSTLRNGWATVQQELARIRTQILAAPDLGYCDEFVLVWSGHGSRGGRLSIHDAAGNTTFVSGRQLADEVDATTEQIEGMQVRTVIDTCYSGQHIATFEQAMPRNPNATDPNQIVRDVFVMTAVGDEVAIGSTAFTDSFTADTMDCIRDARKVDFTTLFDCAQSDSVLRTPQARDWWNNGG